MRRFNNTGSQQINMEEINEPLINFHDRDIRRYQQRHGIFSKKSQSILDNQTCGTGS